MGNGLVSESTAICNSRMGRPTRRNYAKNNKYISKGRKMTKKKGRKKFVQSPELKKHIEILKSNGLNNQIIEAIYLEKKKFAEDNGFSRINRVKAIENQMAAKIKIQKIEQKALSQFFEDRELYDYCAGYNKTSYKIIPRWYDRGKNKADFYQMPLEEYLDSISKTVLEKIEEAKKLDLFSCFSIIAVSSSCKHKDKFRTIVVGEIYGPKTSGEHFASCEYHIAEFSKGEVW